VLAPAQTGTHAAHNGRPRRTYGHSLAVSPWGEVLADGGTETGITYVDLDPEAVAHARHRVPSLTHDRDFRGP
jgi:predicted amidohydrolase